MSKRGNLGQLASLEVTGNSTNRYSTYKFLLEFHSNYVPILHRFVRYSQILVENRRFNLSHLHLAPPPSGVTPLEFRRDLWHQKTRRIALSCGIKISRVDSLNQSQSTRVTDRRRDRQNYDSQDRASIAASRGKKTSSMTQKYSITAFMTTSKCVARPVAGP